MTVKMCIKPFASPINKFAETAGVCRSFHRHIEDKHLHNLKNTSLKKIMPKKPQNIIKRSVALGNGISTQKVTDSIRYGLRAANERTPSRKDKEFIYDVDKLASVPKVQVKNVGDNFMFVCHDQDQEEEREGGIVDTPPKLHVPESKNAETLKIVQTSNIEKTTTDEKEGNSSNVHTNGRSDQASAGTMAFVQILLHTLSCSFSCQQTSCRKMGMVLKHYHSCQEKRRKEAISKVTMRNSGGLNEDNSGGNTSPKCGLCQQFAKIVAQHSMYLCKISPKETGCPVPMCDMMRKIRDSRKNVESPVPMQS